MARTDRGARKRQRLSRSGEFERVYRQGDSHSNRHLVIHAFPRTDDAGSASRFGVSVGRKVGGAVVRNKVKRSLREAYTQLSDQLPEGYDFVLVARPGIEQLVAREGTEGVLSCLRDVLGEAGLGRSV